MGPEGSPRHDWRSIVADFDSESYATRSAAAQHVASVPVAPIIDLVLSALHDEDWAVMIATVNAVLLTADAYVLRLLCDEYSRASAPWCDRVNDELRESQSNGTGDRALTIFKTIAQTEGGAANGARSMLEWINA